MSPTDNAASMSPTVGDMLAAGAERRDEDGVRTAVIVSADDRCGGLRFLRSGGATAGPFEVTVSTQ
jgi:hypothetical protein